MAEVPQQLCCPICGSYEFGEETHRRPARLGIILRGSEGLRFEPSPDEPEEWWEPTYWCADCGNVFLEGTGGSAIADDGSAEAN